MKNQQFTLAETEIEIMYNGINPENIKGTYQNAEEFQTVGLMEWNGGNINRITENDIRDLLSLPKRVWYE